MNEYLSRLNTRLISAGDTATRSETASDLAIFFEQALTGNIEIEDQAFLYTVKALLQLLASEKNSEVRISLLHALVNASSFGLLLGIKLDLDMLTQNLDSYS